MNKAGQGSASMRAATRNLPALFRLMICALLLLGAALLTSTAYTRDGGSGWVHFICDDGDRFAVDYQRSHMRLRHGTGVFALSAEHEHESGYWTYSGGELTLIDTGDRVTLERTTLGSRQQCMVADTAP